MSFSAACLAMPEVVFYGAAEAAIQPTGFQPVVV